MSEQHTPQDDAPLHPVVHASREVRTRAHIWCFLAQAARHKAERLRMSAVCNSLVYAQQWRQKRMGSKGT